MTSRRVAGPQSAWLLWCGLLAFSSGAHATIKTAAANATDQPSAADARALVQRWLLAQEQRSAADYLRCYADAAVWTERRRPGKPVERSGVELQRTVATRLGGQLRLEAGPVRTGNQGRKLTYAAFSLRRQLPTRAEQVSVELLLAMQDGQPRIVKQYDELETTLGAAELAALPRRKGADWLNQAQVNAATYELQLFLQLPQVPQWAQAVRRYVAKGALDCNNEVYDQGCVNDSWHYESPPADAGPDDVCLRRQVLRWVLPHLPAADLRAAMPALVPLVRSAALDANADLAISLLDAIPVGDWETAQPLLRVLAEQAAEETDSRMTELDQHLDALSAPQLRTLVGRRLTYGAVADALSRQTLTPDGCTALLQALRTVPRHDRLPRIRAAQRLGSCPAPTVTAGLLALAKKERDCHVRWAAALTLARLGDRSLLPVGPPQTDAAVLDQACLAGMEDDATQRRERLQSLILPETVLVERITTEDEVQHNGSLESVTHTRKTARALTQKDLETALEFRKQPASPHHPSGYRELARPEGRMGEAESYDLTPGKGKDGRRGLLRVLHRESQVGGSC